MPLTSTFQNNSTKNLISTDVGLKISKPGYDASRTAGNNLVFSSSWPSLPIAFQTTIANPITGLGATATVNHNLKFPPFYFIWAIGTGPDGLGTTSERMIIAQVDGNNLYLSDNSLSSSQTNKLYGASKLHIKCFQVDLSKDVDYALAPGDTFKAAYDPSFGVKIAKATKAIDSRDMRDFALHSRCQSPLVLAVKTEQTASPSNPLTVQYNSKLKYPAWVYGFIRHSNLRYQLAPYYAQAYPITKTDGILSYVTYTAPDIGATLVVLRDPMFAATQTTVQY